MLNQSATDGSVAGTWGDSRRRQQHLQTLQEYRAATTTRASFNDGFMKQLSESNLNNKYSQFRAAQNEHHMLLPYGVENPHVAELPYEEIKPDLTMYETASGLSKGRDTTSPMKRTLQQLSTSSVAPVAVGRSGPRSERGVSTSGLLGEKLNLSQCPSVNTLSQRTWLPHEDPALRYKLNGVPTATETTGLSLSIGYDQNSKVAPGWVHQRHSNLTKKMYAKGLQTFYDEDLKFENKKPPSYPNQRY